MESDDCVDKDDIDQSNRTLDFAKERWNSIGKSDEDDIAIIDVSI